MEWNLTDQYSDVLFRFLASSTIIQTFLKLHILLPGFVWKGPIRDLKIPEGGDGGESVA